MANDWYMTSLVNLLSSVLMAIGMTTKMHR